MERVLRHALSLPRKRRRVIFLAALPLIGGVALMPRMAAAEGLFDFLFGGLTKPQQAQPANVLSDLFGNSQPAPQSRAVASGSGPAFCVRSCDGRYFPLMRGAASPVQICQAFCPASTTKVYFGSNIDTAYATNGESYAESENAYAYRKALRADCTCNGRDPAGLAPIDLALDTSLRPGDVVATSNGLVAYSGPRGGSQSSDFTPVASYPGLTAEVRARLTEIKVAPVRAETVAIDAASADGGGISTAPLPSPLPKPAVGRNKRAEVN
jgi:hypothetical protein